MSRYRKAQFVKPSKGKEWRPIQSSVKIHRFLPSWAVVIMT